MQAEESITRCDLCGSSLLLSEGAPGCLHCLLAAGSDGVDERRFQHYEVTLCDDGSAALELGRGAMGITYRAVDLNLGAPVALKVISERYSNESAARDRFRREARMAAQLRHPNVASVYHFGETATGRCFYAMELVEGETLESRVRREGPLGAELALEIAIQVAHALLAAEKHGLVHRDLKPSNLMLVPNESGSERAPGVKVIDFGLARAMTGEAEGEALTQTGFAGTPGFASPEQYQAAGRKLDVRSDIYSLGATLWYALTEGVPRPGGGLAVERLPAAKVPAPLRALLLRLLATDPAARPQSARALLGELELCRARMEAKPRRRQRLIAAALLLAGLTLAAAGLTTSWFQKNSVPPTEKSIAVLPLENLSEDNKNAFFADGIQDDVLTSLAKISDLKVISRSSVMQYRASATTPRNLHEIARALGVANILEGSVRRNENRVVVSVQLIDVQNDHPIWVERYDRTIADSIGLQGELAVEIAAALKARLAPGEKARLDFKPTNNPDAYLLYLKAREQARVAASKQEAIAADEVFDQAIALDPRFSLAYARAAMLNSLMYRLGREPERKAKARAQSDEALRLQPALGECHLARGLYSYYVEDNFAEALKEFSIASSISPLDPDILELTGTIYQRQGHWPEAMAAFDRAQELDPAHAHLGGPIAHFSLRDWAKAAAGFDRGIQIEPNVAENWLGRASVDVIQTGDIARAQARLEAMPRQLKNALPVLFAKWDLAMTGRDFATAARLVPDMPSEEFPVWYPTRFYQGLVALARGDATTAQTYFEQVRSTFENGLRDHPDAPLFLSAAGQLSTFAGRKEEAIRECRRAVELTPASRDAVRGPSCEARLALAYARLGEPDQALKLLEHLLKVPAGLNLADLRLNWEWDPLRRDPRFQEILAGPEPKTDLTNKPQGVSGQ